MILDENYTLSNGIKIPKIGLGVWEIPNKEAIEAVKSALNIGYRHIDTAEAYGNEEGVGLALKQSNLNREKVFITSKIPAEIKDYHSAKKSIDNSLKRLGTDYIDLMLIHAPQPWHLFGQPNRYFKENVEVYKALEEAYEAKKVKAIGVSNFLICDLENIFKNCKIKPMVNQILTHVNNTPFELIEFCKKHDIVVEAYSPIAHGNALNSEKIKAMAEKYKVSVAQLCIKYTLQLGLVSLPKSANYNHQKQNAELDFEISEEDMKLLF